MSFEKIPLLRNLSAVAHFQGQPPFVRQRKLSGAKAQGVRYERRVQEHLEGVFPNYIASPWFSYWIQNDHRTHWCQPDGLLLDVRSGEITIVEVKYQHCAKAYWQMRNLYLPVLRVAFPGWGFRLCEVVKWYDPATPFPSQVTLCPSILDAPARGVGVHIWKP